MNLAITRSVVTTLALLAIAGCGRSLPETAPVEGRVTLDGKPLTTGVITFIPDKGRPATGAIGSEGAYRLTTFQADDGALPGTHTVTIAADEVVNGSPGPRSYEEEMQPDPLVGQKPSQPPLQLRYIVPAQYSDRITSGLTAEVKAQSEPNRIDFDLHK